MNTFSAISLQSYKVVNLWPPLLCQWKWSICDLLCCASENDQFVTSFVVPVKMINLWPPLLCQWKWSIGDLLCCASENDQLVTSFFVPEKVILFVHIGHVGLILEKIKRMLLYNFFYINKSTNICLHTNHYRMTFLQLWYKIKLHKFEIPWMPKTVKDVTSATARRVSLLLQVHSWIPLLIGQYQNTWTFG
jgi:hypothetical protein